MGAEHVTYRGLFERVNFIRAGLRERGLRAGDRIGVLSRHAVDYVSLYFACAAESMTLVPLSYWHREAEQRDIFGAAKPALLVAEQEFAGQIEGIASALGIPLVLVANGTDAEDGVSPAWSALYGRSGENGEADHGGAHPHMMLFTSGTTGKPKGAMLSQARTVESAYAMSLALGLRTSDVYLDCFRTFHSGSWDHLKLYFLVGATVVFMRDFDAAKAVDVIGMEKVSVLLAGGTMFRLLMDAPRFGRTDLSSLRLVYGGAFEDGTGLAAQFMDVLHRHNARAEYLATYGLTEFGPYVAYMPAAEVPIAPKATGRPLPGVRVELVDDDGNPVPRGTAGEIVAYGPSFDGYLDAPDETAKARLGSGLRTGDVAIEDEHGYLTIVDRKKDVVRSGAHNIFSAQVESCLAVLDEVAEAAVVGVPDALLGETVCAVVVFANGAAADPAAAVDHLQRHVRASLAGYNVPRFVVAVEALPRNSNGKVLKRELRDWLRELPNTGQAPAGAIAALWAREGKGSRHG
jgi:fatty-acyl-CoA synthase